MDVICLVLSRCCHIARVPYKDSCGIKIPHGNPSFPGNGARFQTVSGKVREWSRSTGTGCRFKRAWGYQAYIKTRPVLPLCQMNVPDGMRSTSGSWKWIRCIQRPVLKNPNTSINHCFPVWIWDQGGGEGNLFYSWSLVPCVCHWKCCPDVASSVCGKGMMRQRSPYTPSLSHEARICHTQIPPDIWQVLKTVVPVIGEARSLVG